MGIHVQCSQSLVESFAEIAPISALRHINVQLELVVAGSLAYSYHSIRLPMIHPFPELQFLHSQACLLSPTENPLLFIRSLNHASQRSFAPCMAIVRCASYACSSRLPQHNFYSAMDYPIWIAGVEATGSLTIGIGEAYTINSHAPRHYRCAEER